MDMNIAYLTYLSHITQAIQDIFNPGKETGDFCVDMWMFRITAVIGFGIC